MKLKETRILDAEGARYACIANDYCTRCDCEEYDRILSDADTSSRKPGGITGPHCRSDQGRQRNGRRRARYRFCAFPAHHVPL